MSALEQEILDKIRLLDRPAKQRVAEALSHDLSTTFDVDAWLADLEDIRAAIAQRTGNPAGVSVLDLLEETRDEEP